MQNNRHLNTLATHFLGWQGRISRSEWWLCWGADLALALVFFIAFESSAYKATGFTLPQLAASAFLFWAATCANIKRFHDRNKPWFWSFLAFFPIVGPTWIVIELGILKGTTGRNVFGDDPLAKSQNPLPPLSIQLAEARAGILRQFQAAALPMAETKNLALSLSRKSRPRQTLPPPMIQYCYKRPDRTVTPG